MKKSILLLLVLVMVAGLIVGCRNDGPEPTPDPTTYSLELSDTELSLDVFDKANLTVTVKDNNGAVVTDQNVSWTSDHPEIVTVKDGALEAMAKGTAVITASVGEFSASCTVTVDALVRPQLMVNEVEVHLAKREDRLILPSVKFKSEILDNATYGITYSFSSADNNVATVTNDGKITAVGVGETDITVVANLPRATAAGIDGSLTLNIRVKVLANFAMNIGVADGESTLIYLQGATDGETVYKDSSKVVVLEAIYEGNDISASVVFKSSDNEILLVDEDGVVTLASTARVGDKATVYCEYHSADEGVILSNSVEFTVGKASVTKPVDGEIVIDLSNPESTLDTNALFGEGFVILSVYDLEDQTKVNIWNSEGNCFDASKVALYGNRTLVIESEKISYKMDVLLVSKVITSMDEFLAIFQHSSKITDIIADGYYILGDNIDASGAAFVGRGWYSGDGVGLVGTFDGRGYTIDGFNISSGGGIFGVVSSTATVKNVAFTNIKVNAPTSHAPVLAYAMMGTLENCYFGINELSTSYMSGTAGLFVQSNAKDVIKNVVVVANCAISLPEGFPADKYGILEGATNKGAFENVFVISPDKLFGGTGAIDEATQYSKSVRRFTSMGELLASDYYSEKKVAYPSDIWDTETMTFKSSANAFKAELEALPTEKEISLGEATALLKAYNSYVITSNSEKLTVSDGKVTANQLLAAADGVKVTVAWGEVSKEITITTKNETTLGQKVYLNDNNQATITISGVPTNLTSITAYAMGVNGTEVELTLTCEDGVVSITKEALAAVSAPLATGANELRLVLENNANYYVKNVSFVWVLNTATEILEMREHLVANGNIYDGLLALGADIDLTGVTIKNHGFTNNDTFAGEFDGRNYTISNMSLVDSGNIGLFTNVSGTIKNVKVVNGTISTYAGLLVGAGLTGTVENVYVSGTITSDGMGAGSNLANFGAGLLAGRINAGAKINNAIVEILSMTDGLRLATAFGKLHGGSASESSFTNCYAINAADATYMPYNQGWVKKSFTTGGSNLNFTSLYELWTTNETAKALAVSLGIAEPSEPHECANPCEICGLCASDCTETTCAKKCEGHHECANPCEICGLCASDCEEKQCSEKCQGHGKAEVTLTVPNLLYYANNPEGTNFVISHADLTGIPSSVTVAGIEVGGSIANGALTIPAAAMKADTMPTGLLTIVITTETHIYTIEGAKVVWSINTASDILKMRDHLTVEVDGNNKTYTGLLALGADIDLTGVTIKNHGFTNNDTFAGEFDGRNHTLSNMSIPSNSSNIGLFTNVSGTIKNVKVVNGTLSTYAGLLVGGGLSGTVENVYVSGTVTSDGMGASSNLANFGAGLLAGRINAGAKINNAIVEILSMTDGLRLATAFGKLHGGSASEASFTNCYAINAADATFMPYNQGWVKKSFTTGGSNLNFTSLYELWTTNETAKALAVSLGIAEPSQPHECANPCETCGLCASDCTEAQCSEKCQGHVKTEVTLTVSDLLYYANNPEGTNLVISHADLTGTPSSVKVAGIEVGGSIADGALTIPAAAMKADTMPTGLLTIVITTETHVYTVEGAKVVWSINTASDILKMKNHLTVAADGKTYSGLLALGADIDLNGVTIKNSGLTGTIFAGEFDGKNHTLSNIAANTGNVGLFADVSGTVKNLKVTGTVSANTALIVGGALTGTIENVYASGAITKDGMGETSNLANFGAGLLAGRIQSTAKINNTIVELTSIADGLRLGTAFGKLHGTNNTAIFSNCYAVNASGATYMPYNQGWTKADFPAETSNANFANMSALWENETAAALATSLGLTK